MKFEILWYLNLYIFLCCFCFASDTSCKKEPTCLLTRTHKMKTADCYNKQFRNFPRCLSTDVEVIDLGVNRIRKVTKEDISRFKYLKFLYLGDNLISNIEKDIFEDADKLATLDLSLNAITKVPSVIFQLPSLKTLYLSQNLNINIIDALEASRPISSPLTKIDISETTDEEYYSEFPNFGVVPFLAILNITGNFYFTSTPGLFMGLCNLQRLINKNVTVEYEDPCDCWRINYWLTQRKVKFTPFTCTVLQSKCFYTEFNEEDMQLHNDCIEKISTIQRNNLIKQLSIGFGTTALVILVIFLFCFWRRSRNRNLKNRLKENDKVEDSSLLKLQEKSVPNIYSL